MTAFRLFYSRCVSLLDSDRRAMPVLIDPPIEISPKGWMRLSFQSFEEIKSWADQEFAAWEAWRKSFDQPRLPEPLRSWHGILMNSSRTIMDLATNALSGRSQDIPNFRNRIEQELRKYEQGQAVIAGSLEGQRLIARWNSGDQIGAVLEAVLVVLHSPFDIVFRERPSRGDHMLPALEVVSTISRNTIRSELGINDPTALRESHEAILQELQNRLARSIHCIGDG